MNSWIFAILQARMISSDVASSFPRRTLSSIEIGKRTGSWLTTPIFERSQSRLSESMRQSSIRIFNLAYNEKRWTFLSDFYHFCFERALKTLIRLNSIVIVHQRTTDTSFWKINVVYSCIIYPSVATHKVFTNSVNSLCLPFPCRKTWRFFNQYLWNIL